MESWEEEYVCFSSHIELNSWWPEEDALKYHSYATGCIWVESIDKNAIKNFSVNFTVVADRWNGAMYIGFSMRAKNVIFM